MTRHDLILLEFSPSRAWEDFYSFTLRSTIMFHFNGCNLL